eukprot:GHVU01151131.1.p1 GENE.GHVU01151131.1~~GHVU01151131.1.p1  ORF type:complete len:151 (+),score=9.24 GHVU01151131.1:3-455(+)
MHVNPRCRIPVLPSSVSKALAASHSEVRGERKAPCGCSAVAAAQQALSDTHGHVPPPDNLYIRPTATFPRDAPGMRPPTVEQFGEPSRRTEEELRRWNARLQEIPTTRAYRESPRCNSGHHGHPDPTVPNLLFFLAATEAAGRMLPIYTD